MMAIQRLGTMSAALDAERETAIDHATVETRDAAAATALETLKSLAADLKALIAMEGPGGWDDYGAADAPARPGLLTRGCSSRRPH